MFHLHVLETATKGWLAGYDGSAYSNKVMGRWFGLYKRNVKIYLCFVKHPVYPV